MEKAQHANENPADVKAAEKMARLFDEIKKDNPSDDPTFIHDFNIFLTRLLFCFFAEDTNIFKENQFINSVSSHTDTDGKDLNNYLDKLFDVLNTPENKRNNIPIFLNDFPYVNGGLFKDKITIPKFNRKSRQAIIDAGELSWAQINPDIFGSMFQAVISADQRSGLGQHYTSVPNIMKVIEPLFLNDLKEEFQKVKGNEKKLRQLLHRIQHIKIFDPACGSGNFLIIAYKELRRLEMDILKEVGGMAFSGISLNNFYGIELDDFAHEIAKLSLWLAEHQMNVEFFNEFGRTNPTLPLQEAGQIVCGNACRLDWEQICPQSKGNEIYIFGNPPYLGQRNQSSSQATDMDVAFSGYSNYKNLDYVASWFIKASKYIRTSKNKFAFVTTNSITQGTQVAMLWPKIFDFKLEIFFAFKNFKWTNNAKNNAGVTVCIIGIKSKSTEKKTLYFNNMVLTPSEISPYLTGGEKTIVNKRFDMLNSLPRMEGGNQPREGGFLVLNDKEKNELISNDPSITKFIRRLIGSNELLHDTLRWCIWIRDKEEELEASKNNDIKIRIENVREKRLNGNSLERNFINYSYRFVQNNEAKKSQIIIPIVSSEEREYIPIGIYDNSIIALSSANVIYDSEPFVFSILTSKMHNLWAKAVSGKLESRIRYSAGVCYNSFPINNISNQRKEELTQCTFRILEEREKHSEKTLAQLYDPDKMPEGLREAHRLNDEAVERCYRSTPFSNDEERLEYLFKLYEKMIQEEKDSNTLFATQKNIAPGKSKKKKKL
jgi:type I restriction-modification system DNA methylase subunit